jgi:hypothetical protein
VPLILDSFRNAVAALRRRFSDLDLAIIAKAPLSVGGGDARGF